MIALTETEKTEPIEANDQQKTSTSKEPEPIEQRTDNTLNALPPNTGNKQGDNNKGKGYGQCWECGEWGHPRRECEVYLKRMGK